jgi:hypothetical protein
MESQIVWEDRWGEVIDRPGGGYIEIRWFDTTRDLDKQGFEAWLTGFAHAVESARRPGVLTDATSFRMDMSLMDGAWRDQHIIPRYNAAGVKKFAFIMPEGMPAIGAPPVTEGPATFLTAYFGKREDALAWLAS